MKKASYEADGHTFGESGTAQPLSNEIDKTPDSPSSPPKEMEPMTDEQLLAVWYDLENRVKAIPKRITLQTPNGSRQEKDTEYNSRVAQRTIHIKKLMNLLRIALRDRGLDIRALQIEQQNY